MALEIKENKGIFEIFGNVASQNLGALKVYFGTILESTDAKRGKIISLIGRQNDSILEIMDLTKTYYILSSDRI